MDFEEKDLIDSKITSGRTMVDGILPNSTYISKTEGIYQVSSIHKKDNENIQELLEQIEEEIKISGYISGVEIDQDTDLEKFLFMIKKVSSFHLNVDIEFELKTRKLGNYMANGIYYHNENLIEQMGYHSDIYNIVSVDVNSPSSLIHELTHLIDLSNKDFKDTPERRAMVSHFKTKLFIPDNIERNMSKDYVDSLFNHKEIIARLGEIGYLLNKVGYQGHQNKEELENFFKKVKMMEMMETAGDKEIPVVHSIDFYRKNSFMYFDIDNLKQEELLSIKEYYKSYYNVFEKEFITLDNTNILNNLKKNASSAKNEIKVEENRSKNKSSRFSIEDNPISKVNVDNIIELLKYNDKEKVFSNKELANFLSVELVNINRKRLGEDNWHYAGAFRVIEKVMNYSIETGNKELEKEMFNSICLKADNGYSKISELNKDFSQLECRDLYMMENTNFMHKEAGLYRLIVRDTLKRIQAVSTQKEEDVSYIKTNMHPEMEIDRPLIIQQFNNRLDFLKKFDKSDIYLHKSLSDMSLMFHKYSEKVGDIYESEALRNKLNNDNSFNENNLINFSNLLKATLVLENDQKLSSFKSKITRDIGYYHAGYTKRPSFSLKFENLKEEYLLEIFNDIKDNIKDIPVTLKKNKGLSDNATDKQKMSFLSKLSFKNIKEDFMINFINELDIKEIDMDKRSDIFKEDSSGYSYLSRSRGKHKLISTYLKENSIGLNPEMSSATLNDYSARYAALQSEGLEIVESELMNTSIDSTLKVYIELAEKLEFESKHFLMENKNTHLFLKDLQKNVINFIIEKDLLEDYIEYAKTNNLKDNFRKQKEAVTMIKDLFNLSSVNILEDNSLELLSCKNKHNVKNKLR